MGKNAIVIIYDGSEPSVECMRRVVETLVNNIAVVAPEKVGVYCVEEKDIMQAIVAKAVSSKPEDISERTIEEHSVVYIRTLFPGEPMEFSSRLSARYALAILQNNDKKLVGAVRAIAKGSLDNISLAIRQKYNFGPTEYAIVLNTYNACVGQLGN